MLEKEPGVFDPLSGILSGSESSRRRMTVSDVNDLVALTHQPYMYRKQVEKFEKRFSDLTGYYQNEDMKAANQEAIAVLRFVLQTIWAFSLDEDEIISFAEKAGNVPVKDLYRGESTLTFFGKLSDSPNSSGNNNEQGLDYRFKVSGSYKTSIWCALKRRETSNTYFPFGCSVDGCLVDDSYNIIADVHNHKGPCYFLARASIIENSFNIDKTKDWLKCSTLAALVDYLGTLHLAEVELRVDRGVLFHHTDTLMTQAWRIAFEALTETAARNDKHGKRKPRYRVICCIDCKSPRIVKYGKNAVRCPLCSNNNTKGNKSRQRRVY